MKRGISLVLALLTVALCILPLSAMATTTMYVKTANGKGVHVRSSAVTGTTSNIEYDLPYGSSVNVYGYLNSQWAICQRKEGMGEVYIMARYLVSYYPGAYVPTSSTTTTKTSDGDFSSFKYVSSYDVTIKTSRSGALAKMRWAPSKSASLMETLYAGDTVTVLAEGKNWYQVMDPETGKVGFINTNFINK